MNTKRLNMTVSALGIAMLVGAMVTGCTIIDQQIAMGTGPSAEAAVQRVTDDYSLEKISLDSKNENARVLAVKKLKDESRLLFFLESTFGGDSHPPSIRMAAFNRLVELGVLEKIINEKSNDKCLYAIIVGKPAGANGTAVSFPEDWRIRAINAYDGLESLNVVVMDDTVPIKVRMAAIKKAWWMEQHEYVKILSAAVDKNNPSHADYESLARLYVSENKHYRKDILCNIVCNYDCNVSLDARKLAFSCLKEEKDICYVMGDVANIHSDANMKADDVDVAKYVLEKTDQKTIENFFLYIINKKIIRCSGMTPFLLEASKRISDETMLMKIAEAEAGDVHVYASKVARECVKRIKSPQFKKRCDAVLAKCGEDSKERAEALVRLYPVDPACAYEITKHCFLDDIMAVEDMMTLVGLVKLAKKDKTGSDSWIEERVRKLKVSLLNCVKRQVKAMTDESLKKLVETSKTKAQELSRSGKVCVIGNYYLKMPASSFIALVKTQDVKSTPLNWEWDDETKQVIMTELAFDSKNLYMATGLEKTEAKFGLPSKLGVARFEVGMTEVQYNRNYFAEAMGSYDFNTISGGDIYYRSETQAKNIVLLLWKKSGQLVMRQPE